MPTGNQGRRRQHRGRESGQQAAQAAGGGDRVRCRALQQRPDGTESRRRTAAIEARAAGHELAASEGAASRVGGRGIITEVVSTQLYINPPTAVSSIVTSSTAEYSTFRVMFQQSAPGNAPPRCTGVPAAVSGER